ncbi:MAG: hypothetical protein J5874_04630 [Oscillospiraceae bacterium]|nr:hypothetical protein [Oscillospiraceae bacterium]
MAIIVSDIRLGIDEPEEYAFDEACRRLNIKRSQADRIYLVKSSVDARKKEISFVYSVGVTLKSVGEENIVSKLNDDKIHIQKDVKIAVDHGDEKLRFPPLIVGFGPAGMFAGLLLARNGYSPIILERGEDIDKRVNTVETFWKTGKLDENSNVQFGEGGAGAFSDGKLNTRINDERCRYVLEEFVKAGAPEDILYKSNPHIGTDLLRGVVKSVRSEIEKYGGKIRFGAKAEKFVLKNGRLCGIICNGEYIDSAVAALCIGHSSRDTFESLYKEGFLMQSKPFSVGVRIEHKQKNINEALYGEFAGHPRLGQAEYKLSKRYPDANAVYSFCMCPGGYVVAAASEKDAVVTNGMSSRMRDSENANSALVVSVDQRDFGNGVFSGVEYQRRLERFAYASGKGEYKAPAQTVGNFLNGTDTYRIGKIIPSYPRGVTETDLSAPFSERIVNSLKDGIRSFDLKIKGFADPYAVMTGYETRTSSPVRIIRNGFFTSETADGVYPCGEGAGYAGGIMSAAVDGIRVALAIMNRYAPIE